MAKSEVLCLLFLMAVFSKGVYLTSLVLTDQTVMAAVGEEAHFSCQLMKPKDVLQVTWQKLLPEGEKNIATCNKYFGQKVNPDFRDKMEIKDAGLQNSSIVIRRVTGEDEGCYRCLFNAYPEGALSARTCLQLYVRTLQQKHPLTMRPIKELHVQESKSTEEASVSADGVTWIIVFPVLLCCVVSAVIYFLHQQKNKIRDPEKNETPQKPVKDYHETVTPLIKTVTDHVKQRTSTKKSARSDGLKPSKPKCSRKLFYAS